MPYEINQGDKPSDECGVFAIYAPGTDVARLTYYGLYALQHRGQESAGIAVSAGDKIHTFKSLGLVSEIFNENILCKYSGKMAIGHVQHAIAKEDNIINAQPLLFHYLQGQVALAHNGSLINAQHWRRNLQTTGSVFQTTSDTEVFVNLIAYYSQNPIEEALMKCMIDLKGAYSLVLMTGDKIIGVRDPYGIRPLCLGRLDNKGYVLASESCALDVVGAEFIRDIEPGEIIIIDEQGCKSYKLPGGGKKALCSFEYIYLARPDTILDNRSVGVVRGKMGQVLAKESKIEADFVVPVPDSGIFSAFGYAQESGISLSEGLIKNRYVGRTFIRPTQELREVGVRLKLNPIRSIVKDNDIILVDDSIVRGTTSKQLVALLKKAEAKRVHLAITSPPIKFPCCYGIDMTVKHELIAFKKSVEEIRAYAGADTLTYLSIDGLLEALGGNRDEFCTACFDGNYPVELPETVGNGG